ncbi:unnamed protein product [Cuscuta campestris]|uniref:Uncharacterized protein n=1 Tax=Cuscuta campestris TaxID=132261 RepID=A0A484KLR8_9ASTE|nr:unnamed protein product [Cuscuta campestris]
MGDSVVVRGRAIGAAAFSFLKSADCEEGPVKIAGKEGKGDAGFCDSAGADVFCDRQRRGLVIIGGQIVRHTPYEDTGTNFIGCSRESLFGCRIRISIPYHPFVQQLGALQRVTLDVVYDRHLHNIKSSTMELSDSERHYLDIGNPAHQHGTCYVHISLELHTALSCMTDCHKRLDLGAASIRRMADRRRDAPDVGVRRGGRGQRRRDILCGGGWVVQHCSAGDIYGELKCTNM